VYLPLEKQIFKIFIVIFVDTELQSHTSDTCVWYSYICLLTTGEFRVLIFSVSLVFVIKTYAETHLAQPPC